MEVLVVVLAWVWKKWKDGKTLEFTQIFVTFRGWAGEEVQQCTAVPPLQLLPWDKLGPAVGQSQKSWTKNHSL